MATTYDPATRLNQPQLTASSTAAQQQGVPVNVIRGVTMFKYGPSATAADFNYIGGQLSSWYKHFYLQSGNALVAWQKAAAQEMTGASAFQVAQATASQAAAAAGPSVAFGITGLAGALGAIGPEVGAAVAGESALSGEAATAADTAAATADTGTAAESAAASNAASTLAKAGLAGLLGVSGIEAMLIRGLEALVGVALILLGLSALAGGSGNPVTVTKGAAAKAARFF